MKKLSLSLLGLTLFLAACSGGQANVLKADLQNVPTQLAELTLIGDQSIYTFNYDPERISVGDQSNPESSLFVETGGEITLDTYRLSQAPFAGEISTLKYLGGNEVYRYSFEVGEACEVEAAGVQHGKEALVAELTLCRGDNVAAGVAALESLMSGLKLDDKGLSKYSL